MAGLRRAPNTWPSVMNPASIKVSRTTVGRGRGAGTPRGQIDMRRKARRSLEQAGQHRRFREVHVARRLVEVVLRRRVDAEGAAAEIGAVEIKLENLVLGQPHFE